MSNIIILTDERALSIIKDVNMYAEFPALQSINKTIYEAPKTSGGCSRCNRNRVVKANGTVNNAIASLKDYIRRMDNTTRSKFKAALNCSDIRFTLKGQDGRLREYRY